MCSVTPVDSDKGMHFKTDTLLHLRKHAWLLFLDDALGWQSKVLA
jgi:hypothetical protein